MRGGCGGEWALVCGQALWNWGCGVCFPDGAWELGPGTKCCSSTNSSLAGDLLKTHSTSGGC